MPTCSLPTLQLKTLAAISQVIDTTLDLETALHNVLRILSDTLSMERGTITLRESETGHLVIVASHGLTPEEKERGVYELGEGVTGNIFRTARPYYVEDIHDDPLFLDKTGARRLERGRVSFIGVPIMKQGQPIGVLNVDRLFGDDVPPDEDIEFLGVVATLAAQFISLNEQVFALKRENVTLRHTVLKKEGRYAIGASKSMQVVQNQLERVAPTKATVLLLGESGVGKTLIAQLIHDISDRKSNPFVKVNCASIPNNLLEAELFGHEKGAFTGAVGARMGRFEEAHGGTIFLDEIGELDLALQAKLLRVIQEKEFERIGSNRTRRVDARIIAATNRNLAALAETGEFRQDLYFRLHVFPIAVPPLRERREDIPNLLNHFMVRTSKEYGRTMQLDHQAGTMLASYVWPGNVREMEHVVERLAILAEADVVTLHDVVPLLEKEHLPVNDTGNLSSRLSSPLSSAVPAEAYAAKAMDAHPASRSGDPSRAFSGDPRSLPSRAPSRGGYDAHSSANGFVSAGNGASSMESSSPSCLSGSCLSGAQIPHAGPHCPFAARQGGDVQNEVGVESASLSHHSDLYNTSHDFHTSGGHESPYGNVGGVEHRFYSVPPDEYTAGEAKVDSFGEVQSLHDAEVVQVLNALRRNGWIQHKAANDLGITARQIGYRIKKFNLTTLVALEKAKAKVGG